MKRSGNGLIKLELLYADPYCLALHKEPGIPCQSRHPGPPTPLDRMLGSYLNENLNLWTRIDQPVSGIVLFRRDQDQGKKSGPVIRQKTYLAIVEGHPAEDRGKLKNQIRRDGRLRKAVEDPVQGKWAELSYAVLHRFDRYTLLDVAPHNGRFHQIRFQLARAGWPIKGDVKYGARRKNSDRSIHLHAYQYEIESVCGKLIKIRDGSVPSDVLWDQARNLLRPTPYDPFTPSSLYEI